MRNTVIFYKDWYEAAQDLSPQERLQYYDAIMRYAFEEEVSGNKLIKAATALVRSTIDRDNSSYEEKCERNRRNIMKRWRRRIEAADQQAAADTTVNHSIRPNTTDTDNGNDNGNGNENGNDNKPTAKAVGDRDKEKSTKVDKKKTASTTVRRFIKPTVAEVEAYCKERGNYVDAQQFVDFYESKGWKVGSSPMKDWKAAVRTWEKRDGRARKVAPVGVTLGVGEWIDERGERRYGTGLHTVPMGAPPRPSDGCYWSSETKSWVSGV